MMEKNEIYQAFSHDDRPEVRSAGLRIQTDAPPGLAEPFIVRAMNDPDERVRRTAKAVLYHRQPWLELRPFAVRSIPEGIPPSDALKSWQGLRRGIAEMAVGPPDRAEHCLAPWLAFPGAWPDMVELFEDGGNIKAAQVMRTHIENSGLAKNDRQLLLAPTYTCNLNCSYCYARQWSHRFPGHMSLKDLDSVLAWCRLQKVKLLILAGGEPTLYRYFSEMLRRAAQEGIRVMLTTNTLYNDSVAKFISTDYISQLVAHYDQGLISRREKNFLFNNNLERARQNGVCLFLRYTLTEESTDNEWQHVIKLAQRFEIPSINYAFAFKSFLGNNTAVDYKIESGSNTFERQLVSFAGDCKAAGLSLHLCKPIPLCAMSMDTMRHMFAEHALRCACGAPLRNYSQNVTVNPDLSTLPCNAIGIIGPKITGFKTMEAAGAYFKDFLKSLLYQPLHDRCNDCLFFFRGFCQGVCLAEKYANAKECKHVSPSE